MNLQKYLRIILPHEIQVIMDFMHERTIYFEIYCNLVGNKQIIYKFSKFHNGKIVGFPHMGMFSDIDKLEDTSVIVIDIGRNRSVFHFSELKEIQECIGMTI